MAFKPERFLTNPPATHPSGEPVECQLNATLSSDDSQISYSALEGDLVQEVFLQTHQSG
jgi:hypothetical protein